MSQSLQEIATSYNRAVKVNRRPLATVAEEFGISQSTATRRVAEAKRAGLIQRTEGLPGINPKLVAVARDLGVHPERLREAIIKHAGGDLRTK